MDDLKGRSLCYGKTRNEVLVELMEDLIVEGDHRHPQSVAKAYA